MIFIGLKRSGWPAGLVATAGVMLHYDLKMTGDDTAPKRGEREREKRRRRRCKQGGMRSGGCPAEVI